MRTLRTMRFSVRQRLSLGVLLLLAASAGRAEQTASPDDWIPFEANWSAAGHAHTLSMGTREASTFYLSGPFLVISGAGLGRGFRAQAIGFVERDTLGIGRMVLTDERSSRPAASWSSSSSARRGSCS